VLTLLDDPIVNDALAGRPIGDDNLARIPGVGQVTALEIEIQTEPSPKAEDDEGESEFTMSFSAMSVRLTKNGKPMSLIDYGNALLDDRVPLEEVNARLASFGVRLAPAAPTPTDPSPARPKDGTGIVQLRVSVEGGVESRGVTGKLKVTQTWTGPESHAEPAAESLAKRLERIRDTSLKHLRQSMRARVAK
jgi:hypothetical protein